jgi:hypothetical protein
MDTGVTEVPMDTRAERTGVQGGAWPLPRRTIITDMATTMDTEIITAATGARVSVLPLSVRLPALPPQVLLQSARTLGSRKPDMYTDTNFARER